MLQISLERGTGPSGSEEAACLGTSKKGTHLRMIFSWKTLQGSEALELGSRMGPEAFRMEL